ncbi:hypothetical protein KDN32_08015 [Nocardioides sp. J2M5]|uniref:hypothetical protein n=1 Tax=Nocardioides palaemonis TaxID=2829810 RepID=UPI001BAC9D0D|nr:hypothetical protein [Nocardioides palaemonis]MBS2937685.1 hypothetical protein [Nocardioides palaemonis]
MTTEQAWLVATTAAASVLALVALVVGLRARTRAVRAEARADALARDLADRVALLESPVTTAPPAPAGDDAATFVITALRSDAEVQQAAREIDGRLFTDIVAREAVVAAASWTHGVRRALSAESRNRVRFHVRQETRRAGRERRAEMKQALREFRARERSAGRPAEVGEDVA